MRKFLLFILLIVLIIAMVYKSPFSAMYNYNKAKALCDQKQYEKALPYFERSLFADSKNLLTRYYYALALSKSTPTYSVQKHLYEISDSKIEDEAKRFAKIQVAIMRTNILQGLENNYIYNASMGNDILRWNIKSFPLKIYYENKNDAPSYYYDEIKNAFSLWGSRTNFIKFQETTTPENADILVRFNNYDSKECNNEECKYTIAYTEPNYAKDKLLDKMVITFYKTSPDNKNFSSRQVFNSALHEIGHALGIMGHSDNIKSIMYPQQKQSSPFLSQEQEIDISDLNTLVLLYRLEPTISNTKKLTSETFYYAPLILGNDNIRFMKKLEELKKYIKEYPNIASGYINIASVYVDLGYNDVALKSLDKAENLATTNNEKFTIQYNRAIIYFNMQDYNNSMKYANLAKEITDNDDIKNLIEDIKEFQKN